VAGNGPSDDFNNQQTTKASYDVDGETPEAEHQGFQPAPWYRSPPLLIAWLLLVLILIALIVYGIGELISGDEGTTPVPSTTQSTTTTTEPTSTPTTTPPPSTTTETTPPTSTVEQPTQQQPTYQPTNPPTTKHHPHLPQLPPGIHLPF
jgi:hypothetical protein